MDATKRQITKIAREISKFTARTLRADGVGTAEFDFIHTVRHRPGITQAGVCEVLAIDKGAAARMAANLEAKGYLVRRDNPDDGRSRLLFATEKAQALKNSKAWVEAQCYEWLLAGLSEADSAVFVRLLDTLYLRSKQESRAGFPHYAALVRSAEGESHAAD